MKTSARIVAGLTAGLVMGAMHAQANLVYLLDVGFEFNEGINPETSTQYWNGDGSKIHGVHVLQPDGDPGGNFSISDENNRFLIDDGNARSGSQSARLSVADGAGNYYWLNFTEQGYAPGQYGVQTDIDDSALPIRIGWSLYHPVAGEDVRQNGLQTGTNFGTELWQMRLYSGGVTFESGGATATSNPSSLTGWFDFEIDADFNTHQFIGARYRHQNDASWTELLTGAVDFKGSIAAPTFQTLVFRPDGNPTSPDLALDDLFIAQIPEPGGLVLLAFGGGLMAAFRRRR